MSKSRGNVVNPDEVIEQYGADTMRLYEMFIGDFEKSAPWSTSSIKGCRRFVDRVWGLQDNLNDIDGYSPALVKQIHRTIKKVSEDIEGMKFNTAIAAMMALLNDIDKAGSLSKADYMTLVRLLSPFAPHVTEELWQILGGEGFCSIAQWPAYDEAMCVDNEIEVVVQINGKVRSRVVVAADADKDTLLAAAKADEKIAAELDGATIVKEIVVPGKLVNIVIRK
jgi:leucyl-tRNA synthetase